MGNRLVQLANVKSAMHDVKVAEIATTHAVLLAIVGNLARNE